MGWLEKLETAPCTERAVVPVLIDKDLFEYYPVPVPGYLQLRFYEVHPLSVFISFGFGVTWDLSRDMLRTSLTEAYGSGDVRMAPAPPHHVSILLRPLDETYLFRVWRNDLDAFLQRTAWHVPFGEEDRFLDIDLELAMLRMETEE